MKKIFMVAVATILMQAGFAQINKGQWLAGGNIAFNTQKTGDHKSNSFEFAPDAGYFFIDNFAGGLRFSVTTSKSEFNNVESKYRTTMISPFVRYYFLPAAQKVNVFADASYGFGSTKYDDDDAQSNSGFAFAAGPAIFLSPNTALEITLGYTSFKPEDADDRTNNFRVGVGFQVHLGNGKK
ncbi:MAG TPA: porin family protein [Chitinophagaceae bacterium]|nr:porin family protein [Chitinophagaceae bacterium]